MARVTATEVRTIIVLDPLILDTQVDVFIISANLITNRVETIGGLTDVPTLKEIERWLSAHLLTVRDNRSASEKADVVSQSFQFKLGLNFNVSEYGQNALLLDSSGTLAALQNQAEGEGSATAEFGAMGPVSNEDLKDLFRFACL